MSCIAIIDDRKSFRETVKINLDMHLIPGWESLDIDPFMNLNDYPSWISDYEICAIVVDERLNERAEETEEHVSYCGHDFVDFIRERFPTFPIFVLTTYPDDPDLLDRFGDVEDIIEREEFNKEPENYVPRFIRSAQKFLDTYEQELKELSTLAAMAATGKVNPDDEERMRAIQTKIGFAFPSDVFLERSKILEECENILKRLDKLSKNLNVE